MINKKIYKYKCLRCNKKWSGRMENPKVCIFCHNPNYRTKKLYNENRIVITYSIPPSVKQKLKLISLSKEKPFNSCSGVICFLVEEYCKKHKELLE